MGQDNSKAEEVYTLDRAHDSTVRVVAVSRDNKYFVSAGLDKNIKIWDLIRGKLKHCFERAHEDVIFSLALSNSSEYLVSGSKDGTIKLWDSVNFLLIKSFVKAHDETVFSMVFNNDDKTFLSGSGDKSIKIWSLAEKKPIHKISDAHRETVFSLAVTKDSQYLVSGSKNGVIKIWDMDDFKEWHSFQGNPEQPEIIFCLATTYDNRWIIFGSFENITIYDIHEQKIIKKIERAHSNSVFSIQVSTADRYIISCSADCTIKVWDLRKFENVHTIEDAHEESIFTIGLSSNSRYLVSGSKDFSVKMWDLAPKKELHEIIENAHKDDPIHSVALSNNGKYMATGCINSIRLWDFKNKSIIFEFVKIHDDVISSLVFSFDNSFLLSASHDKSIKLWDVIYKDCIYVFHKTHDDPVIGVTLSSKDDFIVSYTQKEFKVWDLKGLNCVLSVKEPHDEDMTDVKLTQDNNQIITTSDDTTIKIWDLHEYREGVMLQSSQRGTPISSKHTSPEKDKPNTSARAIQQTRALLAPEGFVNKINQLEKEKDQVKFENEILTRKVQELENKLKLAQEQKKEDMEEPLKDYDTSNMHFFPRDIAGHTTSVIDCIIYALEKDIDNFENGFKRKAVSLKKLISSRVLVDEKIMKGLNLKGKTPEHFCDMFEYGQNNGLLVDESLRILSEHFQIGITLIHKKKASFNSESVGGKYTRMIYIKEEDGRFSIMVGNSTKNLTREGDLRVFSRFDIQVKDKIMRSFEQEKSQIANSLDLFNM